jgi:hypothetical protein
VDETSGVDKFVRNEFGQPNGWPERCCARVRLRDEPSISLSMLGWSSVRAFFVSGGERGVDETSGLIRAIPGPHPSGHRRWRCSLRHPAFAVTNSSGTNLDSPRSLGALGARVRLRDEPSISLAMLVWNSVEAFFVSGGERGRTCNLVASSHGSAARGLWMYSM